MWNTDRQTERATFVAICTPFFGYLSHSHPCCVHCAHTIVNRKGTQRVYGVHLIFA